MAFFENMFTKKDDVDMDEFLNNMDVEEEPEEIDFYVKPVSLQTNADIEQIIKELNLRNIVLLDIEGLIKRNPQRVKQFISQIKTYIKDNLGDIAMISKTKLLLVPSKVKIIKKIN
jgi:SepF-like predicted cell division protein (DUF552 family)